MAPTYIVLLLAGSVIDGGIGAGQAWKKEGEELIQSEVSQALPRGLLKNQTCLHERRWKSRDTQYKLKNQRPGTRYCRFEHHLDGKQ